MSRASLRSLRLSFVDDLSVPAFSDADSDHLTRVLRMRVGDRLAAGDGAGHWREVELAEAGRLVSRSEIRFEPRPHPPITVAFAPTKGGRPEGVIQKLTELGVDRIAPVVTERTVVRWPPKRVAKQVARWHKIAREAARQSRRLYFPQIDAPEPLGRFLETEPEAAVCDPNGRDLSVQDRVVVIGPEGGFTPEELGGQRLVRLPGSAILRAETAAIAAATLLGSARERQSISSSE